MQCINDISTFDRRKISDNELWKVGDDKEFLVHRIHAYPAKFPSFLVRKIINYFENAGKELDCVVDPFCGCGTSAVEAALLGKNYWGCDINPVATIIARTKSNSYEISKLEDLFLKIINQAQDPSTKEHIIFQENQRINYWFNKNIAEQLALLIGAIEITTPSGKYRDFFLTGFSNILKPCSKWLTKSIKPQIDPNKIPAQPLDAFKKQISMMIKAFEEINQIPKKSTKIQIENRNLLNISPKNSFADAIITSPPYVTSYEYADIHQLSSIWLGFSEDYRDLRKGSIGSEYTKCDIDEVYERSNTIAKEIFLALRRKDNSKAKSVLKYFYDLNAAVAISRNIVKENGVMAYVIGNTIYKGVYIDNAKFLAQSLLENNFKNINISRRKISNKILTPYRDKYGRFSSHAQGRKIYSHEYVLLCEK